MAEMPLPTTATAGWSISGTVAEAFDLDIGVVYPALSYDDDHPDVMRDVRYREATALDDLEPRAIDPPVEPRDAP